MDTREEENRNSLFGICRSHQIENPRFPCHPFGEPTVERCCAPKSVREIAKPVGKVLHPINRRRLPSEMSSANCPVS